MKKLLAIIVLSLLLNACGNNEEKSLTLNCVFVNGKSFIQGNVINVTKGFSSTKDLIIILDTPNKKIKSFGTTGVSANALEVRNIMWSETEIYWRYYIEEAKNAYTDYSLNRVSGRLTTAFDSNQVKYGTSNYTYNCNKSSQKF